jgi:stearoyl-CoA desaturase (Delta-9 desaturase)
MPNDIPKTHQVPHHDSLLRFRFIVTHLVAIGGVLATGIGWKSFLLCVTLYVVRMFGVTAGYHRYFSHRSFKTSRVFAFLLAFLAQSSAQRGVIWWARNHRHHHRYSDRPKDLHSPVQHGFWHSHIGWIFSLKAYQKYDNIRDLERVPELQWLDKRPMFPAIVLAIGCTLAMGLEGLTVGFFLSTILLFHGTFTINSLAHVWGNQRFKTSDQSRNNLFLALITLGEGWHNNHHRYMRSVRQGFYWWEIDLTYYALKGFEALGLIWELRLPPKEILEEGRLADSQKQSS